MHWYSADIKKHELMWKDIKHVAELCFIWTCVNVYVFMQKYVYICIYTYILTKLLILASLRNEIIRIWDRKEWRGELNPLFIHFYTCFLQQYVAIPTILHLRVGNGNLVSYSVSSEEQCLIETKNTGSGAMFLGLQCWLHHWPACMFH
jgi:hypothetical protein